MSQKHFCPKLTRAEEQILSQARTYGVDKPRGLTVRYRFYEVQENGKCCANRASYLFTTIKAVGKTYQRHYTTGGARFTTKKQYAGEELYLCRFHYGKLRRAYQRKCWKLLFS